MENFHRHDDFYTVQTLYSILNLTLTENVCLFTLNNNNNINNNNRFYYILFKNYLLIYLFTNYLHYLYSVFTYGDFGRFSSLLGTNWLSRYTHIYLQ